MSMPVAAVAQACEGAHERYFAGSVAFGGSRMPGGRNGGCVASATTAERTLNTYR